MKCARVRRTEFRITERELEKHSRIINVFVKNVHKSVTLCYNECTIKQPDIKR